MTKTGRKRGNDLKKLLKKNRQVDEKLLRQVLSALRKLRRGGARESATYNLMRPFSRRSLVQGSESVVTSGTFQLHKQR